MTSNSGFSMQPPNFCAFTHSARVAPLNHPASAVPRSAIRFQMRAQQFWKIAAVAFGALACFTPLSAGAALIGGGLFAWRKSARAGRALEELQLRAAHFNLEQRP